MRRDGKCAADVSLPALGISVCLLPTCISLSRPHLNNSPLPLRGGLQLERVGKSDAHLAACLDNNPSGYL